LESAIRAETFEAGVALIDRDRGMVTSNMQRGKSVMVDEIEEYFSGRKLYGDDFSPEKISIWFSEEEKGYFDLATSHNSEYDYQEHFA
jgi:hypothetical protein